MGDPMLKTLGKTLVVWVGCGLLANLAWEMFQMSFYEGFHGGWSQCLLASLGDVALLTCLYALMACASEDWLWFERLSRWRLLLLAVLGLLVAAVVELRALAAGAWRYDAKMPRLPWLGTGLLPTLQMILIALALAWLSRVWTSGRFHGHSEGN